MQKHKRVLKQASWNWRGKQVRYHKDQLEFESLVFLKLVAESI